MDESDDAPSLIKSRSAIPLVLAACTTLAALIVYVRTLAPTITWRNAGSDSGDLVTAAINLGVPHPTGYPLYTVIAHLFTILPGIEPARGVNLFSAVSAALAAGAIAWTSYRLAATKEGCSRALAAVIGWAAAATYGFGQLVWSQATIAEVYSLHALFVSLLLAVALCGCARMRPYALTLLFGMGLAHHVSIVLLLPALWPYLPSIRRWLTVRRLPVLAMLLLTGVLAYVYIPLRASRSPMPNWGQADTLNGFVWLASGTAYRQYVQTLPSAELLQRLRAWMGIWLRDFGAVGLALAMMGFRRGLGSDRRFTLFGLTYVILVSVYAMCYLTYDSYLYLIPAAAVVALWMARGASVVLDGLASWRLSSRGSRLLTIAVLSILALLPVRSAVAHRPAMDLSMEHEAYDFAHDVLMSAAPDAVVISSGDKQTFALWYLRYGLQVRPDLVVIDQRLLGFGWYRDQLAAQLPELAALAKANSALEATAMLVQDTGLSRPIHLTFADESVLGLATWIKEGSLHSLVRD